MPISARPPRSRGQALGLSKPVLSACKAVEGGRSFFWRCKKNEQGFDRLSTNGLYLTFRQTFFDMLTPMMRGSRVKMLVVRPDSSELRKASVIGVELKARKRVV